MYDQFGLFINGSWVKSTTSIPVFSPVTEESIGDCPTADKQLTEQAIESACLALEKLDAMGGWGRAEALHKVADNMIARADEAAQIISTETGKPIAQAAREWVLAIEQFRWHAEEARRIYGRLIQTRVPGGQFQVVREAIGVVGAFTAWNFPAALPARKLSPALAAGCPVVLRPSSQTPGTAMIMVDCIANAGFPEGAVSLVVGATKDTYEPIIADSRVRKVTLTGSTRIGQQMIRDAADTVKKVSMELGGNAPLIIFDDADLENAIDLSIATKYANCGQVCVTPDRFFVHEAIYDEFVSKFVERVSRLKLGDGINPETTLGPLISKARLNEIDTIVQNAVAGGATVAFGGERDTNFTKGHFYKPTVLTHVDDEVEAFSNENFGPIAAIAKFSTDEEAYQRANASTMGLSAYAFTQSIDRARMASKRLKAGMVGINSFALAAAEAPFGGTNFSGMGREGGSEAINEFLDTKLVQLVF